VDRGMRSPVRLPLPNVVVRAPAPNGWSLTWYAPGPGLVDRGERVGRFAPSDGPPCVGFVESACGPNALGKSCVPGPGESVTGRFRRSPTPKLAALPDSWVEMACAPKALGASYVPAPGVSSPCLRMRSFRPKEWEGDVACVDWAWWPMDDSVSSTMHNAE